jgi:hypothetical protein
MVPIEELKALAVKWKRLAELRNRAWEGGERTSLRFCAQTLDELVKQREEAVEVEINTAEKLYKTATYTLNECQVAALRAGLILLRYRGRQNMDAIRDAITNDGKYEYPADAQLRSLSEYLGAVIDDPSRVTE